MPFKYNYSQRELDIARLRQTGMTYSEIGKKYGLCYQRVQTIYMRTLEKLRVTRDINRNWAPLYKVCKQHGVDDIRFMAIVKLLKRNGIISIRSTQLANPESYLQIKGIGVKYAEMIFEATKTGGV